MLELLDKLSFLLFVVFGGSAFLLSLFAAFVILFEKLTGPTQNNQIVEEDEEK